MKAYIGGIMTTNNITADDRFERKADAGKPQLTLVPPEIIYTIAQGSDFLAKNDGGIKRCGH